MNTTSLRDALTTLGISAATPGVRGDDRRAILLARYEEAIGTSPPGKLAGSSCDARNMTDLRRELEQLGISTNTPGLRGDERRATLLQRLQQHRNMSGAGSGGTTSYLVPQKSTSAWLPEPAHDDNNQTATTLNTPTKATDSTGDDYDGTTESTSPMKRSQKQKLQASQLKAEIQSIQKARSAAIAAALGEDTVAFYTQKLLDVDHQKMEGAASMTQAAMDSLVEIEAALRDKLRAANDKELRVREVERNNNEYGVHVEHEKVQLLRNLQEEIAREGIQGFHDLVRIAGQDEEHPTPSRPPPSPTKHAKAARKNPLLTMTTLDDLRRQTLPVVSKTDMVGRAGQRDRTTTFDFTPDVASHSRADKLGRKAFFLHKVKGDFAQAEEAYTQAIELDPTHGVNLGHFAMFLDHIAQRADDAEEYYLRAIDATADNALHLSHYANFLQRVRGDAHRAEAYYVRCMTAFPRHASNLGNYANFLRYTKRDLVQAEACFVKALKMDPTHVNNLSQYASLLSEMGKLEHADAMYQKAMQMDNENVTICGNYANLLVKRRQLPAAKALYLKAMALDRENLHTQQNYALFLRDHPSMRTGETRPIKMHPKDRWVQLKQDTTLLVKASTAFRIK
ncbi:hypothetical protein H310_06762 [Aphanomyces invadans]|uniref:Uncharacterized protein n=1 Tax=Aphanomyces invadans TaxID=157072 RepID=A0A024U5I6_9STRA|nr:hypothetical protein H310_06762 [Aphanomyces invadans]ETW01162.1 hypothetical protein H310_06762 [Aphanomyces invadans]|eukprot:XP_008870160.1 hypothetical protein H310_06762 [Aphanomyces invadans]